MTSTQIETTINQYRNAVSKGDGEAIENLCLPWATIIACDEEGTLIKQTPKEFAQHVVHEEQAGTSALEYQESAQDLAIDFADDEVAIVKQKARKGSLRFSEMLSFRKFKEGWRLVGRVISNITRSKVLSPVYAA